MSKLIPKCLNNSRNSFGKLKPGYHIERDINGNYVQVPDNNPGAEHGTTISALSGTIQNNSNKALAAKSHKNRVRSKTQARKDYADERAERAVAARQEENQRGALAYTKTIDLDQQNANNEAGVGKGVDYVITQAQTPFKFFTEAGLYILPGVGFGKAANEALHGETEKAKESAENSVVPTVLGMTGIGAGIPGFTGLLSRGINTGAGAYFVYDAGKDMADNGINLANGTQMALGSIPLLNVGRGAYNNARYTYRRLKEDPGAWYAPFEYGLAHSGPGKRFIELGMKADGYGKSTNTLFNLYDPRTEIKNLTTAGLTPTTIARAVTAGSIRNDIEALKYIFGNNKKSLKRLTLYNGSLNLEGFPGDNDYIRAYLYGENPGLRLTKGDFGAHTNYVKNEKPNTKYVYHTDAPYFDYSTLGVPVSLNATSHYVYGNTGNFETFDKNSIDVAGHLMELGVDDTGKLVVRGLDAWRFDPNAYKKRYALSPSRIFDFGLHTIDEAGNKSVPITRTNWALADTESIELNDALIDAVHKNKALQDAFYTNFKFR